MVAAAAFKHGDALNQITVFAKDNDANKDLKVILFKKTHENTPPYLTIVAEVVTTGAPATQGSHTVTFPVEVIDNTAYSYFLEAWCPGD